MAMPSKESKPFLAVDINPQNIRALLFEIDKGRYRLAGVGASSTVDCLFNVNHGILQAVQRLQDQTNKCFNLSTGLSQVRDVDKEENQQEPVEFIATHFTGRMFKVLLVCLREYESSQNICSLVKAIPVGRLEKIILNDGKELIEHLELFVRFRPDMVLIDGSFEKSGSPQSLEQNEDLNGKRAAFLNFLQFIPLACKQIPQNEQPEVLFAGNLELQADVDRLFTGVLPLNSSPDPHPSIATENSTENFEQTFEQVACMISRLFVRQHPDLANLPLYINDWQPASIAFSRAVRFINANNPSEKCLLAIDINSQTTSLAVGNNGKSILRIYPRISSALGLGRIDRRQYEPGMSKKYSPIQSRIHVSEAQSGVGDLVDRVLLWSGMPLSENFIREYIFNKSSNPSSLPFTREELAIEKAILKLALQEAIGELVASGDSGITNPVGLRKQIEPVIATGSFLDYFESPGQAMLVLLDGLQPAGITTIVLDSNQVLTTLGAIMPVRPILAVQVLESSSFLHLGTVITPVGKAKPGSPVLRVKLEFEDGDRQVLDVTYGSMMVIPLKKGQPVQLHLQPFQKFDIGMGGAGRGGALHVIGGLIGLVIDARGRPLRLQQDAYLRYELYQKWGKELDWQCL